MSDLMRISEVTIDTTGGPVQGYAVWRTADGPVECVVVPAGPFETTEEFCARLAAEEPLQLKLHVPETDSARP